MTQKELKEGIQFEFSNENWCEQNLSDDLRCGTIEFNARFNWFSIFFNGTCVHTSNTFKSAENRLIKLMDKWNCEFNKN